MIKERLFGTDGVRGVANIGLTSSLALELGMAAGQWVQQNRPLRTSPPADRPFVIIGRDTRLSGDMLEAALAAGLTSMGVDVVNIGIVPTPAVAQIVLALQADAGVVISASHNPFEDNGIKFFGSNGRKLPDRVEDEIEAILSALNTLPRPTGGDIGRIQESRAPVEIYVNRVMATLSNPVANSTEEDVDSFELDSVDSFVSNSFNARPLAGMSLVMDCANGAAYELAPDIFTRLGADLTVLHDEPDGVNINVQCGSTRPQEMAAKVKEIGAHAGMAFDGDADRVMLADEHGDIVDGDRMMAIIGQHLHAQGRLTGKVVVATIMSNVGLEQALAEQHIRLHRTDVGDRYVAEAMEALGAAIGGEQSGHILLPHMTPTGDGLVTALQVLDVIRETGKPLSELAGVVRSGPQLLKSVRVRSQRGWKEDPDIQAAIAAGQSKLGSAEWLSVRASGTEPLIRVMAQGTERAIVESVVEEICAVVQSKLG